MSRCPPSQTTWRVFKSCLHSFSMSQNLGGVAICPSRIQLSSNHRVPCWCSVDPESGGYVARTVWLKDREEASMTALLSLPSKSWSESYMTFDSLPTSSFPRWMWRSGWWWRSQQSPTAAGLCCCWRLLQSRIEWPRGYGGSWWATKPRNSILGQQPTVYKLFLTRSPSFARTSDSFSRKHHQNRACSRCCSSKSLARYEQARLLLLPRQECKTTLRSVLFFAAHKSWSAPVMIEVSRCIVHVLMNMCSWTCAHESGRKSASEILMVTTFSSSVWRVEPLLSA